MKSGNMKLTLAALVLIAAFGGCNGELTDSAAPVELVVTNTQNIQILDLDPVVSAADIDCQQDIGTITMQVFAKRTDVTGTASQVRVTRYRVSYQRTDGGRLVPASFVRPTDALVSIGESTGLSDFLIIEPDALSQAPFAALLPQNGGRDPDTGRPIVKMDVIVELFGETLGGDNVSDATRFPLDFCYGCGGCF